MEFKIKQRKHHNIPKYPGEDYKTAERFVERLQKELGDFLRAGVLFGSVGREEKTQYEKDIDVLLVVNDLTLIVSPEVVEAYRVITERVAAGTSRRLHVTTLKMTTFWDFVRGGDPIVINILRDGIPLYDTGFFEPLQVLLFQGRIRPTEESVWVYFSRAPATLLNSKWHVLQAALDLYWAVIDAAHAALMRLGEVPPAPSKVASMMRQKMVKPGLIPKRYADVMDFFYELSKNITHREIQEISGQQYEKYYKEASDFVNKMQHIIERRIAPKKK
ncbi:hypothetical protein JW707_04170 [Candidatus Woesearchaeota archaeon]|nr:hypothetical protein [Candidatus Woesearchaeota archaeon]